MHSTRVVPTAPRLDNAEDLPPFPPDTIWTWVATRQPDHLVLPVHGRRSIFVSWPPGSYCETCSAIVSYGYAGPVSGDRAHFPSATVHRVCEPCARRSLGLGPAELTGHRCVDACTDRLHLEVVDVKELASADLDIASVPNRVRASIVTAGDGAVADDGCARKTQGPGTIPGSEEPSSPLGTLTARGWQIAEITALPRRCSHGTQRHAAVWIEPIRPLPWPTERDDPWVW